MNRSLHHLNMIGILFLAAFSASCGGTTFAPEVTCDGIRQLRRGMSESDVTKVMGEPLMKTPGAQCSEGVDFPAHEPYRACWSYSRGRVRFFARFANSGLSYASGYSKGPFDERDTPLFDLGESGVHESAAFTKELDCSALKRRD